MKVRIESPTGLPMDTSVLDAETGKPLHEMGIDVISVTVDVDRLPTITLEVSLKSFLFVGTPRFIGDKDLAMRILRAIAQDGELEL